MKIGICDDNKLYLKYLVQEVNKLLSYSRDYEIIALTPSELAAQLEKSSFPYDIVISDIDMGVFSGIDLARKINLVNPSCSIIFISNYLNYATEVYDVSHIYFVLKSEAQVRLPKALEKAIQVYNDRMKHYLTIQFQNTVSRVSLMDITHIEAMGRYLYIHDLKQSYKYINSLKLIASELPDYFVRCHNSYIINLNYIRSLNRTSCILPSDNKVPISQTYSKSFQAAYISFVSGKLT